MLKNSITCHLVLSRFDMPAIVKRPCLGPACKRVGTHLQREGVTTQDFTRSTHPVQLRCDDVSCLEVVPVPPTCMLAGPPFR